MEHYFVEKPNLDQLDEANAVQQYLSSYQELYPFLEKVNENDYLYWTDLKYKPRPSKMSAEQFWMLVRLIRRFSSKPLPVIDQSGKNFTWFRQDGLEKSLNRMDMELGGKMVTTASLSTENHQRFVARGVLEEAIASSQLEGASTTRRVAKEMIAEQRAPKTKSEQMIYNNYQTMRAIEESMAAMPLSEELLFELHSKLVDKTMDSPDEVGRLRNDADQIVVEDSTSGMIVYTPPNQEILARELPRLIAFANDDEGPFIHPIVKAIILHFWIGYLHPFVDGNGRMARILFYWYLLKHDYWMLAYVPISSVIKRAAGRYKDAYIFAEQDGSDMTYFISYHVERLLKAMDELKDYVKNIDDENKQIDSLLGPKYGLNERQKQLLHYLLAGSATESATITSHQTLNGISRLTADKDLKDLQEKELVESTKVGRTYKFYATDNLKRLVDESNAHKIS